MTKRSLILGMIIGTAVSSAVYAGLGVSRMAALGLDDSMAPDEVKTLRRETIGMRHLLLPVLVGKTTADLVDLGASEVRHAWGEAHIARFGTGEVYLKIDGSHVSDILIYCWRYRSEGKCSEGGAD